MQDSNPSEPLETARNGPQSSRSVPARKPATRPRSASSTGRTGVSARDDASGDEADNDEDDGDDEDDDEDNDEEPEAFAPSCARRVHKTGRKISPLPDAGDFFDDDDDNDDDDDDAIYERVNDYTDSDGGINEESEEQIEAFEEQDILHEFEAFGDEEEALHEFLDNIDGLSAVGYGGDIDPLEALEAFSDDSGSSTDTTVTRHVHFQSDVEQGAKILSASLSPLLTRASLPSALPEDVGVSGRSAMSQFSIMGAGSDPWSFQSSASPQQRGTYYEDSDCMLPMLVIDPQLTAFVS
jgi:hypothetical protein